MKWALYIALLGTVIAMPVQADDNTIIIKDKGALISIDLNHLMDKTCIEQSSKGDGVNFLNDGTYELHDGNYGVVTNGCWGQPKQAATLKDGRIIYTTAITHNGNNVYTKKGGKFIPLINGDYILRNGTKFSVTNGIIDEYGHFVNGIFYLEDRN